jgi:hypothetical protein
MSASAPTPDADLEALVRALLQHQAERIDPAPVYARLCVSLAASPQLDPLVPSLLRRRFWRRVAWATAAAAALLFAFLGGLQLRSGQASAESIIQQAQAAHSLPLDRCYLVEVRRDSPLLDESTPLTIPPRVIQLWTRGDRIWIESVQPKRRWAWGRDENGNVWMAFGPHRAIRFTRDEVPPWLALGCDIFAMRLETLLDEVLRDFVLERTTDGAGMPAAQVVTATVKPGHQHPNLRQARIEIDAETKVIRRLVLTRTRQGQPFATITYTLVESRPQDDSKYVLEGHLAAPFEVFTPTTHPQECRKILDGWFDPRHGELFHLPNPGK